MASVPKPPNGRSSMTVEEVAAWYQEGELSQVYKCLDCRKWDSAPEYVRLDSVFCKADVASSAMSCTDTRMALHFHRRSRKEARPTRGHAGRRQITPREGISGQVEGESLSSCKLASQTRREDMCISPAFLIITGYLGTA